ncbi:hypothetical protein AZSI13_18920 [Azospira sp. I13]|nr:hypothetical protein AZSI13_18920 [Azospira sp. I13]
MGAALGPTGTASLPLHRHARRGKQDAILHPTTPEYRTPIAAQGRPEPKPRPACLSSLRQRKGHSITLSVTAVPCEANGA